MPFLVWFVGLAVTVQEIFVLPWLLYSQPVKKNFPLRVPTTQQADQSAVLGRLSLSVCLWAEPPPTTSKVPYSVHIIHT
jgi:hypothetical protein